MEFKLSWVSWRQLLSLRTGIQGMQADRQAIVAGRQVGSVRDGYCFVGFWFQGERRGRERIEDLRSEQREGETERTTAHHK